MHVEPVPCSLLGMCLFFCRGEKEHQIAVLHPRKLNIFQLHGTGGAHNTDVPGAAMVYVLVVLAL